MMLGLAAVYLFRVPLTEAAVVNGLQRAGAGDIKFRITQASPWVLRMEDLAFRVKTQSFAASRVLLEREHWWKPTLGSVRIEGAAVPVTIDGSDTNPFAWASYAGTDPEAAAGGAVAVPVDRVSIDGQLVVKTATQNQPLTFTFFAEPAGSGQRWQGRVEASGSGVTLKATGSYGLADGKWEMKSEAVALDLQPWSGVIQQLAVVPMGPWDLSGRVTAELTGGNQSGATSLAGRVQLQDVAAKNSDGNIEATGVSADLEFTDFRQLISAKPGAVRVTALRFGKLAVQDLSATVSLAAGGKVAVHRTALKLLGGSVTAEPFVLTLGKNELEAVILADDLDVAQILALTKDLPAKAQGRVAGRLPIFLSEHGLRLGTGWLELKKGVYAELQLKAEGLITGGMSPKDSSYVIMKRVENGLLQLRLNELRLDVRPTDAPRGRTARVHFEGEPTDPNVKVPVVLDVNVNGPLEQLLNFSMKDNLSFSLGK